MYVSLFHTKELSISAIKGARLGQKAIQLEPVLPTDNKITIGNYSDLKNSENLKLWVKEHFVDLDAIDLEDSHTAILQNPRLGLTEQDRKDRYEKTKELALAYNIWSAALSFVLIFFSNLFSTLSLLLFPLLGLIILITSKGLTKLFSNSGRSAYNNIALGFLFACMFLLIKSCLDYRVLNVNDLWLPMLPVSITVFILTAIYGFNRSIGEVTVQFIVMIIAALLYSCGSVRQINCFFDHSKPKVFAATVVDHRVEHNKGDHYYLKLSAWGPKHEKEDIELNETLYTEKHIGDTVHVSLKEGALHIP